jgi:predicted transcriptional regulator
MTDVGLHILKALNSTALSRKEMFAIAGTSGDSRAFMRHIKPLMNDGFIEMTIPDKPNSRFQKYRLTGKGKTLIKGLET